MIGMTGGRRLEDIRDLFMYCTLGEIEFLLLLSRKFLSFSGLRHMDVASRTTVFSLGKSLGFVPYSILFLVLVLAPLSLKSETSLDFHQDGLPGHNGSVFQNAIGDRSFFW